MYHHHHHHLKSEKEYDSDSDLQSSQASLHFLFSVTFAAAFLFLQSFLCSHLSCICDNNVDDDLAFELLFAQLFDFVMIYFYD